MLVSPIVSAHVAYDVVIGIYVLTLHGVDGVRTAELLNVSVFCSYPGVRMLANNVSAGVANTVIVSSIYVIALVLYGKVVAALYRLMPVLCFVGVPRFVVSALAHYVLAQVTLAVVFVLVDVSGLVGCLGFTTAGGLVPVLVFGDSPFGLKGMYVSLFIAAYTDTVSAVVKGVRNNLGSVGLSVVSALKRTPVTFIVMFPLLAFLVHLGMSTGYVLTNVAYAVVILVYVSSLVRVCNSVIAGGRVPVLIGVARPCVAVRMLVIVIPLALFYVTDTVVVCVYVSTLNVRLTLIALEVSVVVLVRGTSYCSLALVTLKVAVRINVL